jgi:cytoskeleton protein RodZ
MSEAAETVVVLDDAGPGRMLSQLRNERKLSVADVAQRLKYGVRQIEALEAEEFGRLPGTTFVRGMVRGYAKLLEIDPLPVLKALERRHVPGVVSVDLRAKRVPFPEGGRRRRSTRTYLSLSLGALVVVAAVLYEWHSGGLPWPRIAQAPQARPLKPQAPEPVQSAERQARDPVPAAMENPAATPAPAPVAAKIVPPTVPAAKPSLPAPQPLQSYEPSAGQAAGHVRLEVDSDSWIEIKEEGGRTLMSQLVPAGSHRVVTGRPPLSVVIGNAAAVHLSYNDAPVDLKPYIKIEVARLTLD